VLNQEKANLLRMAGAYDDVVEELVRCREHIQRKSFCGPRTIDVNVCNENWDYNPPEDDVWETY
jgi:hypothetical protein